MNEFIKELISRLEERSKEYNSGVRLHGKPEEMLTHEAIEIVNQLAEEYNHCIKSSCSNCEVYDTEKHYCPKWCDVIKGTVAEIEENHSNDFCEWNYSSLDEDLIRPYHHKTSVGMYTECLKNNPYCSCCGKKIKIISNSEIPNNWQQQTMNRFERVE